MDNKTRFERYALEGDVASLCSEIAALDRRLCQVEQSLKAMQNAFQTYGNVALSGNITFGGEVYSLNTAYPQQYVPIKETNDSK